MLDYQTCNVKNFLEVTRCFKCQSYGHITKVCPAETSTCGQCAAEHDTRECKSIIKSCVNCKKLGGESDHSAAAPNCEAHRTLSELRAAMTALRSGGAPGPDCVEVTTLQQALSASEEYILQVMTDCLNCGYFPKAWKRVTIPNHP